MRRERIKPWKTLGSETGPGLKLFGSRFDHVENPRNGMRMEAVVIESEDWVNIVALTPAREIVLVEQYRFGTGKVSLEVPAGVVDPGEPPLETAKRELLEETGYSSDNWKPIGKVESNPAFMNNACHFWLATDAVQSSAQSLDEGEDIAIVELTREELAGAIERGEMRNSLSLLALARVFDMRDGDWG